MRKFDIGGMSCAVCSARVERAVSSVEGVSECSVNLLTNSMQIKGNASDEAVIAAVTDAGYTASVQGIETKSVKSDDGSKTIKLRLIFSLIFLSLLMYVSMGHIMWNWYLPPVLADSPMSLALCELVLSAVILVINQKFFISGFKAVINKSPNMDTLVALGSGASFVYSLYLIFAMSIDPLSPHAMHYLHDMYFESAAMILVLITVGKMLEARSKGKTTTALNELINLAPQKAALIDDDKEIIVDASSLKIGDIIAVRPGESFAADCVIIEGEGSVDESALTGESIPVDKTVGDRVHTATINKFGFLKCEVTGTGEDTALSKIIKMVSDASASKAPIAKIADKVSAVFVPVVIAIAALSFIIWMIAGESVGFSLARAISVLVISCPCALGLATPVAIMVGSGLGAKSGILFKNAEVLENLGRVDTVVFDKTGTITKGEPGITDIMVFNDYSEAEFLNLAYSLESGSEHPLAKAVVKEAKNRSMLPMNISDFKAVPGNGLSAVINNEQIFGGSFRYISSLKLDMSQAAELNKKLSSEGKTAMFFASEKELIGAIAVADSIKDECADAIDRLHKMGINTVMLTGDNAITANAIAQKAGIDKVIAEVLPDGKEKHIRDIKNRSAVAMVGDGINDAPALTSADIGIAVSNGTDIAIDAAGVVMMKDSLLDIPAAITLSRLTLKNIKENLFWAFIYNIIDIPLAAGLFISLFGWQLTPMFGAAAMSLSSFCVVTNALRLNFAKIYERNVKYKNHHKKENETMEKTIKIEGMMCPHCEARVKGLLEAEDGVIEAKVSHESGTAVLTLTKDISDDTFAKIITDAGYKVV